MKFVKHYVTDMDESMVQNCIFCGETISDYRNTMQPIGQPAPRGFPLGDVFVSDTKNPKIFVRELPAEDEFEKCQ